MLCCSSKSVVAEEVRPLTAQEKVQSDVQEAKVASPLQRCIASCCCLQVIDRDDTAVLVTKDTTPAPSLYQRLCMCQCAPRPRPHAGIEMIPELRGLAGVSLQLGDHETAGSLQTVKWGYFDPEKRVAEMAVFGGFYQSTQGLWTEPIEPLWCFLMNLGRTANYTYRFEFSEDYRSCDIKIKGNPLFVCCCCCPCIPAWFTIPSCISSTTMVQSQDSKDGTSWDRFNGSCGKEQTFYYKLVEVIDLNGQPGRYFDKLPLNAPKQQMVTF